MSDMMKDFGEPVFTYTRADAIRDGVLIDVTECDGVRPWIKVPMAITVGLWEEAKALEGWTDIEALTDARQEAFIGSLALASANAFERQREELVTFDFWLQDSRRKLWATVSHEAPDGGVCVTVMRPEDY